MKKKLIILSLLIFSGCSKEKAVLTTDIKTLQMVKDGGGTITYVTVVVDGNEYYASRAYGQRWILCPKLSPKVERHISNE